jgi:hypothetical protein
LPNNKGFGRQKPEEEQGNREKYTNVGLCTEHSCTGLTGPFLSKYCVNLIEEEVCLLPNTKGFGRQIPEEEQGNREKYTNVGLCTEHWCPGLTGPLLSKYCVNLMPTLMYILQHV